MTIAAYIKKSRDAGRFPSMPIDGAAGRYWLCDDEWRGIIDEKNWFDSREKAMAFRSKALEKASK